MVMNIFTLPKAFLIGLCLVIVLTIIFLPGCAREKITIPQNLDELSLSSMWKNTAEATGVQEGSEELESLYLHADKEGNVNSLSFVFHGSDSKGRTKAYFVSRYTNGETNWHSYDSQSVTVTRHPAEIFSEIDKLGLSSLEPGEDGLLVQVDFTFGDVGYNYDYLDIYQLEDGNLRPLEEIIFHSQYPWATVSVYKLFSSGQDGQSYSTTAGPVPHGERTSQVWILGEDVNKAEIVKYL